MADDFLPLFPVETEDAILARWRSWANQGLDPTSDPDLYVDTREGSMWWIVNIQQIREFARFYELAGNDVPRSTFPQYAWGPYLDARAAERGIERQAATFATTTLTLAGPPTTPIGAGSIFTTDSGLSFAIVVGGAIDGDGSTNFVAVCTQSGVIGNVALNAVTTSSIAGVTVTGSTVAVGGREAQTDEALSGRVVATFIPLGAGNETALERWAKETDGIDRADVIAEPFGPGTALIVVLGPANAAVSDVTINTAQNDIDPPLYASTLTSAVTFPASTIPVASTGGTRASGIIRIGDQFVTYTGKTGTTFTGVTGGTGTAPSGSTVSQSGRGGGRAPIGLYVAVLKATPLPVTIIGNLELAPGYSFNGDGSLIDVTAPIKAALAAYLSTVQSGGEIVWAKVVSAVTDVQGVDDFHEVQIKLGSGAPAAVLANVVVPTSPPSVPFLQAATLAVV